MELETGLIFTFTLFYLFHFARCYIFHVIELHEYNLGIK